MVHRATLTSSVELFSGFTSTASLKDMGDGYAIELAYTRKGRAVAWVKGKIENDAVNQARNELIEHIEKLGWERRTDFWNDQPTYTGGVTLRWTPPENDPEGDDPNEGESFDAFMIRTVYAPAWAQGEYPDLGDI